MLFCRFIAIFLIFIVNFCYAQPLIVKYVPGNYLFDNLHRIELFNPKETVLNISGFLLVTRDYSCKLPKNTYILPGQKFVIGKKSTPKSKLQLELSKCPDFFIRINNHSTEGNYFVIFDPYLTLIEGFYHFSSASVPFLPDKGTAVLANSNIIHYQIPAENHPIWGSFLVGDDPAIGFEKANNKWRIASSNPYKNINPSVIFKDLNLRYNQGVVSLKWATEFEENGKNFWLERSSDAVNFEVITSWECNNKGKEIQKYVYYDEKVVQDKTYYYRIRHIDLLGNEISKTATFKTEETPVEFWIEAYSNDISDNQDISFRFFSAFNQNVKLKILDFKMREIATVFQAKVFAENQNLIKLTKSLKPGSYWVLAYTENKRFAKSFEIS